MKPKWLIEHFDDRNGTHKLRNEVLRQGYEVEYVEYLPLQSGSYNVFGDEDCVITQTSINLAQQIIRDKPKWVPGPWLTAENYKCTHYYPRLGQYLFNDPYIVMPRGDVPRHLSQLDTWLGKDDCLFIRPDSALKPFSAKIFDRTNFEKDWKWVEEFTEPESLIVLSSPKDILGEWRFIVAGTEVVTGSQYQLNKKFDMAPTYPERARALAEEIAQVYQPDSMFTIDICLGADQKYYLLELGAFSVAGLYACNMEKIVEAAAKTAEKDWNDLQP